MSDQWERGWKNMLRLFFIFLPIFAVFLLNSCNGPGVNAYHRGNYAYEYGKYKIAFANYLYAANQDVVPAEYAVGYQYFYGQGTKRDERKGINWLQCAAHHSLRAQYALHLIQANRPEQPWIFQLRNPQNKKTKMHSPQACIIKVQCAQ